MSYIGNNKITGVYIGNDSIKSIYVGTNKVFSKGENVKNELCFTANTANSSIQLEQKGKTLWFGSYSVNGGPWRTYNPGSIERIINLPNVGDKVYFKGFLSLAPSITAYLHFIITGSVSASGNIMSLCSEDNYENVRTIPYNYCFCRLFENCTGLTSAPELPATTLKLGCYMQMFKGTGITSAPELPATTLQNACYSSMFEDCVNLIYAPELPALTLAQQCYYNMFCWCTSLTTVPQLPATNLVNQCYYNMFQGCSNLTSLPLLPATNLADYCYLQMFMYCEKIKLSTVRTGAYQNEYRIPAVGTGIVGEDSLMDMFYDTGGTFKGDPAINTTYYTSNTLV